MEVFFVAFNAVMPMFVYLISGFLARKSGLVKRELLDELNGMIFKVFFSTLLFSNIYDIELSEAMNTDLVLIGVLGLVIIATILIFIVPKIVKDRKRIGVVIQGCIRGNFVLLGMSLAASVYGADNLGSVSIAVAIFVPVINIISVLSLEIFKGGEIKPKKLIKSIFKNPLVLGALIGVIYNALPIHTPEFFKIALDDFVGVSTPLAIFVLGGTLNFSSIGNNAKYLVCIIFTKLFVCPTVMVIIAYFLGSSGLDLFTVLVLFASPVAVGTYAMSQSFDADYELAGQLIAISTVISLFTLFTFIFVLGYLQLI